MKKYYVLRKINPEAKYEVDPRNHCLSETSCDDCSWGGPCPRHSN